MTEDEAKKARLQSNVRSFVDNAGLVFRAVFGLKEVKKHVPPVGASARPNINTTARAVMVVEQKETHWERLASHLSATPIIQSLMAVTKQVAESPVGKAAAVVRDRVNDKKEEIREKWETSQHPLVYNAAAVAEAMWAESESAAATRALRQTDPDFDVPDFVRDMEEEIIPVVIDAFLRGNRKILAQWCLESAMGPMSAVFLARAAGGLVVDPTILSISHVEYIDAKLPARGPPVLLLTAMVQQVNCITNLKVTC